MRPTEPTLPEFEAELDKLVKNPKVLKALCDYRKLAIQLKREEFSEETRILCENQREECVRLGVGDIFISKFSASIIDPARNPGYYRLIEDKFKEGACCT